MAGKKRSKSGRKTKLLSFLMSDTETASNSSSNTAMSIGEQQPSSSNLDSAVANNNQPQDDFNLSAADHPTQELIGGEQPSEQCYIPFAFLTSTIVNGEIVFLDEEENPQDIVPGGLCHTLFSFVNMSFYYKWGRSNSKIHVPRASMGVPRALIHPIMSRRKWEDRDQARARRKELHQQVKTPSEINSRQVVRELDTDIISEFEKQKTELAKQSEITNFIDEGRVADKNVHLATKERVSSY
ncbi:hypothetical protein GOBAR_DD05113 [Gossypium barbadense]|nr:hypothetical protein GOBAR_DD05113 [Gossypium barbadense]